MPVKASNFLWKTRVWHWATLPITMSALLYQVTSSLHYRCSSIGILQTWDVFLVSFLKPSKDVSDQLACFEAESQTPFLEADKYLPPPQILSQHKSWSPCVHQLFLQASFSSVWSKKGIKLIYSYTELSAFFPFTNWFKSYSGRICNKRKGFQGIWLPVCGPTDKKRLTFHQA